MDIESIFIDPETLIAQDLNEHNPSLPHSLPNSDTVEASDPLANLFDTITHAAIAETSKETLPDIFDATTTKPPCQHEQCNFPTFNAIASSFARMDKAQRVGVVRCMFLATAAPKGDTNYLDGPQATARSKKRKTSGTNSISQRPNFIYACRRRRLCREAFAALVCLGVKTVERHAEQISSGEEFGLYESGHSNARQGKNGLQRLIVAGFLRSYGTSFGLECPRGRRSGEEEPLRLLPSTMTKIDVYDQYIGSFQKLADAVFQMYPVTKRQEKALSYNLFLRYWKEDCPTLTIAKSDRDFCDLCTALKDDLTHLSIDDERHQATKELLEKHRKEAQQEFLFYREYQSKAATNPNGNERHLVFDFAEKVLLPKLKNQPGQLHFVTRLKLDLFAVSSSNANTNFIFGNPEGHWPNEKIANVVISMIHHVLSSKRISEDQGVLPDVFNYMQTTVPGKTKTDTFWCTYVGGL